MVATNKNKAEDISICIDPRDLNIALKHPHHPMLLKRLHHKCKKKNLLSCGR